MKISQKLVATALALTACVASAGNVAPLGLELGVATLESVQKSIGVKTALSRAGTNRYTRGPMLAAHGDGINVKDLSDVIFIFDTGGILRAVVMYFPNGEGTRGGRVATFRKAMNALAAQYTLVEKRMPTVGDSYARFKQGNAIIELEAPRYEFDMTLRYMTIELQDAFNNQTSMETQPAKTQSGPG